MSNDSADTPAIEPADATLVARGAAAALPVALHRKGVRHSLRALGHRDFAIFWCGALASNTGGWLSSLAVPYVLYELTGSAVWVALVSVAQFLPGIFLSPTAGALADRRDRRRVLIFTQAGMSVSALLLWAAWASGWRDPAVILLLVGLSGVFSGINMPSWQAFVSDLVPRPDLLSAVTLNSLQFNAARSLGPAVAGLILAMLGPSWAFLLNGLSFVFVLLALSLVRAPHVRVAPASTDSVGRQLLSTVAYIRGQPGIVISLVVSLAVGLLGNPIFQFTVVFAGSVFHVGPVELGCLLAALGVGAVIAAPLVSGWNHRVTLGHVVRWGLVLYGLAIIAFGLAPGYVAGLGALVTVGGSFLAVISAVNTSIQIIVADRMRGRVMAARIMIVSVAFPLGGLVQGLVSDWLGPRTAVVGAGALMLLFAVVVMRWRGTATLDRLNDPHDDASDVPPPRSAHIVNMSKKILKAVQPLASPRTVNTLFRLGPELLARLPLARWGSNGVRHEHSWLPKVAGRLPVRIPVLASATSRTTAIPAVVRVRVWLDGANLVPGHIDSAEGLADDLVAFSRGPPASDSA